VPAIQADRRKGLSRESAARRIERLVNANWGFAVRADFDRFFDRIPQRLLEDRLEAWIGEGRTVAAIMAFVRSGIDGDVGIPTGSPLSPLLGNLFLDRFDELIELAGGKLVRYADDFLILTRTRAEAERLFKRSGELAAGLLLKLNDDATILDLHEPFDFLGFRFTHAERWHYFGPNGPRLVHELGWQDSDKTPSPLSLQLPGESNEHAAAGILVIGPGIERLDVIGDTLQIITASASEERREPLAGIECIVLLGPTGWTADAPGKLLRAGIPVHLVGETGWPLGELTTDTTDDPEALMAQCRAAEDPGAALRIAKPLVRTKLMNFATLWTALDANDPGPGRLRELAADAACAMSLNSLRGFEGAAASAWYRALPRFLGGGFRFPGRVSPDATDPVNVMLNIGYTMLHRHAVAAARAAGLSPAIGFLHESTPRSAALGADLQEPFRHLVERAVILASRRLKPAQFVPREDGPYSLVMEFHAAKQFHAVLQRSWKLAVIGRGQTEPKAWLGQMLTSARALRRHLLDAASPWEPFEHA